MKTVIKILIIIAILGCGINIYFIFKENSYFYQQFYHIFSITEKDIFVCIFIIKALINLSVLIVFSSPSTNNGLVACGILSIIFGSLLAGILMLSCKDILEDDKGVESHTEYSYDDAPKYKDDYAEFHYKSNSTEKKSSVVVKNKNVEYIKNEYKHNQKENTKIDSEISKLSNKEKEELMIKRGFITVENLSNSKENDD